MFLIHSRESLKRIGIRFSQTCGGDKRDRTADPLLAKQVLSQLSYTPISRVENPQGPSKLNNDKSETRSDLGYKRLCDTLFSIERR